MRSKKKIGLLFALVLFLFCAMILAVSAADTTQTSAHGYRVTNGGIYFYYQYLEDAIADVPEGGTVTMLKNTSETLPTLRVDRTYTIDGAGYKMTITPGTTETVVDKGGYTATADKAAIHMYEGHVTIKNMTFLLASGYSTNAAIYLQNPDRKVGSTSLVLDNVVMEFTSKYGIWLHQESVVTIKGANTRISGGTTNMIRMQKAAYASRVTVEDGVIGANSTLLEMKGAGGSFTMTGGRLEVGSTLLFVNTANISVSVNISNSVVDLSKQSSTLVSLVSGAQVNSSMIKSSDLVLAEDLAVPSLSCVECSSCTLVVKNTLGGLPVNQNLTVLAYSSVKSLIENYVAGAMPSIKISDFYRVSVNGDGNWSPLVVQNGATVTVAGGSYTTKASSMFVVVNGTLNIKHGYFQTNAVNGKVIEVPKNASSTSRISITDGEIYFAGGNTTAAALLHISAPITVTIGGGTFSYIENFDVNNTSWGQSNAQGNSSGISIYDCGGAKITVTGGTFFAGGAYGAFVIDHANSKLSLDGVQCYGYRAVLAYKATEVKISGGEYRPNPGQTSSYNIWMNTNSNSALQIMGGEFYAEGTGASIRLSGKCAVDISGGTFTKNGSAAVLFLDSANVSLTIGGNGSTAPVFFAKATGTSVIECSADAKVLIEGGKFHANGTLILCRAQATPDLEINGGFFVLGENAPALIGAGGMMFIPTINEATVLLGASQTVIFEYMVAESASYHVRYGGKPYSVWQKSLATDASLDVSNQDALYKGASVLVGKSDAGSGIRFVTVLSETVIAQLRQRTGEMRFGTVIAPLDYVTAAGAFTVAALEKLSVAGDKYEKVEANYSIRDVDGDGIPESYACGLVKLQEKNYARKFAAISYVEINGVMYYGSFSSDDNARSIRDIARKALVAGYYELDEEKEALMRYAGFLQPNATPLSLSWQKGIITSSTHTFPERVMSLSGYIYSEPILLEKAGDTLVFVDASGKAVGSNTYAVSYWSEVDGTWTLDKSKPNLAGEDAALIYQMEGATAFVYVASEPNECVRLCYRTDGTGETEPDVYRFASNDRGTIARQEQWEDEVITADFAIGKIPLAECEIVVPTNVTVSEWRFAIFLQQLLYERTNTQVPIVTEANTKASGVIVIGSLCKGHSYDARHQYISRMMGNVWQISAESFYGYDAVLSYIDKTLFAAGTTTVHLNNTHNVTGSGAANVTQPLESESEVRMMYNNIWGGTEGNVAQRAEMLLELYAEYMPDVLGLQEYAPALRKAGMDAGLAALGYAEVPTDPKAQYYGSETQTRTPMFYNKATVELLSYGYLCLAVTDYGAYPELLGSYTEAEVEAIAKSDRSKSVTWGVFRMKETGHIFLAGSVHLWWTGDAVSDVARVIQMRAMREALTAAAAKYMKANGLTGNLPVFIGGDYNSRSVDRPSYNTMSNGKTPFTNLNDLAPEGHKITKTTSLSYPTYDQELDIWVKCKSSNNSYAYAIDHIFMGNAALGQVMVDHMGVLEEYYAFASDHHAIFADLNFSAGSPKI